MNERIKELAKQAGLEMCSCGCNAPTRQTAKFAELIVEECRNVVTEVYRNTPLELCGPLITADEEIAEHFFGVEE